MVIEHVHYTLNDLRHKGSRHTYYGNKQHFEEWDISTAGEVSGPDVVEAVLSVS